ncbi:MAG: hypothetical protein MJ193_01415, partial [Clostridia bacterium]|nr:hypothetical protein [Clostridia bacterium]
NTPFTLNLILNSGAPENPTCKWYIKTGDTQKQIDGQNKTTLSYSFTEVTSETITLSAKANDVESINKLTIKVEYATLDNVTITSSTDNIADEEINILLEDIHAIELSANWNESALPKETVCTTKWYIDGSSTPYNTNKSFSYLPASIVGTHTITLEVADNSATPIVKTATITLNIIEIFLPIDKVELSVESEATIIGSGECAQYLFKSNYPVTVNLSASTHPSSGIDTSLLNKVAWKWSHYDNVKNEHVEEAILDTDCEASFMPAYGENYVTAIINGIESKHISIIFLNDSDYTANKKAIDDAYVWENGVYNHYITSQEDLNVAVSYLASKRISTDDYANNLDKTFFYTIPSYFEISTGSPTATANIALNAIDEAGSFVWRSEGNTDGYYMYFHSSSAFGNPTVDYTPAEDVDQATNVILHYLAISESDRRTILPIDDNPEYPEKITNSDMLWRVVSWGYKPTFNSDEVGTKLSSLYDEARDVLTTYIKDTDTELEKVRIIYEWIAQKVDYDYAMLEASAYMGAGEGLQYNAYYLEGVFTDADGEGHGQGVCDARSKAFALLCGMEDIRAIRITGYGKGEKHAWNKVFIDADNNGSKEWYFCDPTWGDRGTTGGGAVKEEKLTMQYFLVTDAYVATSHIADEYCYNPVANTTYNYYQNTAIENGTDSFDLYLNSNAELKIALKYAKDDHICIDFRIDTSVWASHGIFNTAIKLTGIGGSYILFPLDEANGNYMIEFV